MNSLASIAKHRARIASLISGSLVAHHAAVAAARVRIRQLTQKTISDMGPGIIKSWGREENSRSRPKYELLVIAYRILE